MEAKKKTGTFAQIATVGPDNTAYSDIGLASGTTYCYRVRAFNKFRDSDYSNETCGSSAIADSNNLQTFALSVGKDGNGSGTVTSSPLQGLQVAILTPTISDAKTRRAKSILMTTA